MKYQAHIGDRTFDITLTDDALTLDGEPVAYSFEQLSPTYYTLILDDKSTAVVIEKLPNGHLRITAPDGRVDVQVKDEKALLLERFGLTEDDNTADREIRAPMPGLVLKVLVEPGDTVDAGDGLIVLEAMKMENELRATGAGIVKGVHTTPGDAVAKNQLLLELDI